MKTGCFQVVISITWLLLLSTLNFKQKKAQDKLHLEEQSIWAFGFVNIVAWSLYIDWKHYVPMVSYRSPWSAT